MSQISATLAGGSLAKPDIPLGAIPKSYGATPGQIALNWVLQRGQLMLPLPAGGNPVHLLENMAKVGIPLSDEEFATLDRLGA